MQHHNQIIEINQKYTTTHASQDLDKSNYIALSLLDALGVQDPEQHKIELMESMVALAMQQIMKIKKLKICIGNDGTAQRILTNQLEVLRGVRSKKSAA